MCACRVIPAFLTLTTEKNERAAGVAHLAQCGEVCMHRPELLPSNPGVRFVS
jgi:hypothetical protein